jgi:hypothetical protein
MGDSTLHPAYAYDHSQGLFVGTSVEGSVIKIRPDVNAKFYEDAKQTTAFQLLQRPGCPAAQPIYDALDKAFAKDIPQYGFRPSLLFLSNDDNNNNNQDNDNNSHFNHNKKHLANDMPLTSTWDAANATATNPTGTSSMISMSSGGQFHDTF